MFHGEIGMPQRSC